MHLTTNPLKKTPRLRDEGTARAKMQDSEITLHCKLV